MRGARNLGMTLLAVWVLLTNLLFFLHIGIPGLGAIVAVIGILAGALLLAGR